MVIEVPEGRHTFTATLWLARDDAPWHFVTLPTGLADLIADESPPRTGFGSVRVRVHVGDSSWHTSLFPDSKAGSYVLPIKKDIRQRERLSAGDQVEVRLELAGS